MAEVPPLPVNSKTPPTDSSLTFGPGAVASLTSGQQKAAPKPKKQRDMSHPSPAPQPTPDVGFREAELPVDQAPSTPVQPSIPNGPPIPVLQRYGVNMGIYDVNNEVDKLTEVYRQKFGHSPPPGLVFDVLKAQGKTGPMDYNQLFGIPTTAREAIHAGIARFGSGDDIATLPVVEPSVKDLVKGLQNAIKTDESTKVNPSDAFVQAGHTDASNFHQVTFWNQYKDEFNAALADPEKRDIVIKGLMEVAPLGVMARRINPTLTQEMIAHDYARIKLADLKASGIAMPKGALGALFTPLGQIAYATTDMPYGFYKLVRGVGLDAYNLSLYGAHQMTGSWAVGPSPDVQKMLHTAHIFEGMGKSIALDVEHPYGRSGYLLMDIWALATAGTGAFGRVSRAAAAEGFAEKARALAFRAPPSSTTMGFAGYHESLPLSDTTIVRVLQQHMPIVGRFARQERLSAEQTDAFDHNIATALTNRLMSTPKMLANARNRRLQIEYAIALTPVVEMQRLMRWDSVAKSVLQEAFAGGDWKNWKTMTVEQKLGVQRALHLIMSDSPDPVREWTAYHQQQLQQIAEAKGDFTHESASQLAEEKDISLEEATHQLAAQKKFMRAQDQFEYSIRAHQAQLESIETALGIIRNPPARFAPLLDRAYQVSALQEQAKLEVSGFSQELADQHIAAIGAKLRGAHVIDLGNGFKGITEGDYSGVFSNHEKATNRLAEAQKRLSKAERNERLHPGTMTQEIALAKKAVETHKGLLDTLEKRVKEIRDSAYPLTKAVGESGKVGDEFLKQDIERLAKREGVRGVLWGGPEDSHVGVRAENAYNRQTQKIEVVEPGREQPVVSGRTGNILRDKHFNRDNTNDYAGALHEIAHHVFQTREASFPESKAWINQTKWRPTAQEARLEEEAASSLWAIENSAEPLRSMVLVQLLKFWGSYVENFAYEPRLGPAGEKLLGLMDEGASEAGDNLAAIRAGTPGSAYSGPMQSERYRGNKLRNVPGVRRTRFGVRPVDFPIKTWTGKTLEMGDYRWDVTELLAEQMKMAHRAATKKVQWQDLWNAADESPVTARHRPIRDISTIPDELRDFVEGLEKTNLDQRFANIATEAKMEALQKFLYPTEEELRNGTVPHEHVKYVDEHLILDKVGGVPVEVWQTIDRMLNNTMGLVNEPMRLFLIYGTPAYLMNALGSASLLLTHQGFLAPVSLGRSMAASHIYGPEATRIIDRLAGETHATSLMTEKTWYTKGSQYAQAFWSRATDTYFRRAAVIHELRRHGFLRDELAHDEHVAVLQDAANSNKISQAAQTGRKAMLDFNSISWPERAAMRHMFFVYSFVRASGIWSLRFLRDHGVLSDVLAHSGEDRKRNIEELIGHMPDWFMRAGYFAVQPDVIHNPIQWNMPGMLEQIVTPLSAIFGHTPYSNAAQLLGPGAVMGTEIMTGHDTQGKALPGNGGSLEGSFLDLWNQTPEGQFGVKQAKTKKQAQYQLPDEPVHSGFTDPVGAALQRERGGINQQVFDTDGFWNTWGQALFRSGLPRSVNPIAGEARYWRDLRATNLPEFHKHEMDMVMKMVHRQEIVVGEHAPGEVIRAVDTISHVSQAIEDYKLKHKGEPTPNQKTINQITIDALAASGQLKDKSTWLARNKKAIDPAEVKSIQTEVLYAVGGMAWKLWVDKVNKIDTYAQPRFDAAVQRLQATGIGDYAATLKVAHADRWAYGRKAEKVLENSHGLIQKMGSLSGYDQQIARQEWIKFVNDNDHEVTINGNTYPSPFAYDFAAHSPDEQQKALAVYAKRKPSEQTAFQTQLLTGTRPDPVVTTAWATLSTWLKDAQSKLPFGGHLQTGLKDFYGNTLASRSPEFKKAWQFEHQPLAKRMLTYQTIKNSPYRDAWDFVLSNAAGRFDQLASSYKRDDGTVNMSLVRDAWKLDVPKFAELIKSRYGDKKGFMSELHLYTGARNVQTADAYLNKFLMKLTSP